MPVDRRQVTIGGAVAVLLILAVWWLWPAAPAIDPGATPPARGNVARSGPALEPMAPVKLGSLNEARRQPGDAERNPFRFQPRMTPPPPRSANPAPVVEAPRVPTPPPGPPPLPPIPLKFFGVLERANGVKWAVLTDGKSGPMYGKEGDIIDGRYLIVKIGTESIEMTYADGRGRQVIRLTGQ